MTREFTVANRELQYGDLTFHARASRAMALDALELGYTPAPVIMAAVRSMVR